MLPPMRWVLLCALALTSACGSGGDDGGGDDDGGPDGGVDLSVEIYDPDRVATYDIALPPASVTALEADPETYVRGTLTYGDEVVRDIGVRIKGEWNFRPLGQKSAFKLKFDEFVAGQTFHGLKRMTFNNCLEDPSFVAERLTYHVFRAAELPAPRTSSAWVTVNGEPYGLYLNIETEDKRMLARWFSDDGGNLYEEGAEELSPGNEDTFELETNETENDRSDLIAFIAAIAAADDETLLEDLAAVLDGDAFLRFCAQEAAVLQWDGYCHTRFGPNNFRLYSDPTSGQFHFLPWGMDMSWKPHEANLDPMDARGMLLQRCLAGMSCRAAYIGAVRDAADQLEALDLPALAERWGDQVRPFVEMDPKREVDLDGFEGSLSEVTQRTRNRAAELRAATE
jgi:spore coat protein CotH